MVSFVICVIAIYADNSTLYSKFDQASNLWQQLELASGFESDLRDYCGQGREVSCWFQCWKNSTGLSSPITLVLLVWKLMGLFLKKNHLLRSWGWLSLRNWIGALTLSQLLNLPSGKLEPWFVLWSFFLLRLLCISINLPYSHAWNTVVTSRLVPLVATWNYQISSKNGYVGLLVLHLLHLLNSWLIVEMELVYVFSLGITLVDVRLNWLNWFHFHIVEGVLLVILIDCMIFLSPLLDVTRMSMSAVSFLAQLNSGILFLYNVFLWPMMFSCDLWCFPLTCNVFLSTPKLL